jgi:Tol biopolymer transport system component
MDTRGCTLVALALLAAPAPGQTTTLVSLDSAGLQGNNPSDNHYVSISGEGRYVAFCSYASNLVPGDANFATDVFVRDRQLGVTTRVSVDSSGAEADGPSGSYGLALSSDGRFVAFGSWADNLVPGDTNGKVDVFVHDRQTGVTERVSLGPAGLEGDGDSFYPSISADGRYVAFDSWATNLVAGDTNSTRDVFVRDRQNGVTVRASVSSAGVQGIYQSDSASISLDGRWVAFESSATNLVSGDTNAKYDVFVHDLLTGTTERVSVSSSGAQADDSSWRPSISADGRSVAFTSWATNLVPSAGAGSDVFVHDRQTGATERASVDSSGNPGDHASDYPTITPDGRFIAFASIASNLVPGDSNLHWDIFVRDLQSGTTERVSVDRSGAQANDDSGDRCSTSGDGRCIAFPSWATNLVTGDSNSYPDIFVRERSSVPGVDLCQPGVGSTIACPCANPAASAPRGCDNSAGTGGAQLSSSGSASLTVDTVVFLTNGERPTATSVLLQGTVEVTNGLVFGQGVRCLGGALRRLYVKSASGGSITAPGGGDPSVSARSAALGDPIAPNSNRWYAVYYRDPFVLGGCPAASTFNITQTQLVSWGP